MISKIHYKPLEEGGYSSKELEFIEITNNNSRTRDLTGYYIRELGISYQFLSNATVAANEKIYLSGDATAFEDFYGFAPFDEFTRDLSNSSYKIILSDAYGNTIDEVWYTDSDPWPESADGTGPYLQLVDLNSDNSNGKRLTITTIVVLITARAVIFIEFEIANSFSIPLLIL